MHAKKNYSIRDGKFRKVVWFGRKCQIGKGHNGLECECPRAKKTRNFILRFLKSHHTFKWGYKKECALFDAAIRTTLLLSSTVPVCGTFVRS